MCADKWILAVHTIESSKSNISRMKASNSKDKAPTGNYNNLNPPNPNKCPKTTQSSTTTTYHSNKSQAVTNMK